MRRLPTKFHAAADYPGGLSLIAAPSVLRMPAPASVLLRAAGAGALAASAVTDWELAAVRKLPVPVHLGLDAATGAGLTAAAVLLRRAGRPPGEWLPALVAGVGEIAVAALTEPRAGDRGGQAAGEGAAEAPNAEQVAVPRPVTATPPRAPAPVETPGPSVTPPALPESETERAERADATAPDPELLAERTSGPVDALVAREESAAAAEAGAIGGPRSPEEDELDPGMGPVYEGGGGEAEGFEQAERDLIENATHGDGHGDPARDASPPEAESDLTTAVDAPGDDIEATAAVQDPDEGPDDPAAGPASPADRGA